MYIMISFCIFISICIYIYLKETTTNTFSFVSLAGLSKKQQIPFYHIQLAQLHHTDIKRWLEYGVKVCLEGANLINQFDRGQPRDYIDFSICKSIYL